MILVSGASQMAGSLALKNDVQLVTQLPQSRRQVHDVLSAAESVPPISDSEVTCGPTTRPATLSSSATSSSSSTDFSSSSSSSSIYPLPILAAPPLDTRPYISRFALGPGFVCRKVTTSAMLTQRSCCLLQRLSAAGPSLGIELAGTLLCGL